MVVIGDESWWSGEDTSHCGQERRRVMVVRGGDESWWSEEETSHVMVHGGQGRRPVMGGDQSLWFGEIIRKTIWS